MDTNTSICGTCSILTRDRQSENRIVCSIPFLQRLDILRELQKQIGAGHRWLPILTMTDTKIFSSRMGIPEISPTMISLYSGRWHPILLQKKKCWKRFQQ